MVETIGKPVFHRYSGDLFGAWMIDAMDADGETGNKVSTINRSWLQKLRNIDEILCVYL